MWNKNVALICVILSITLFFLSCTEHIAGTITQSGNGVVSGMVTDSSVPVSGARVIVIPVDYDPGSEIHLPDSLIDTTNETGNFCITASIKTRYNVEVSHGSAKMALLFGVDIIPDDTQHVSPLALTIPGCISVIVNDTGNLDSAYVYIPGTTVSSQFTGNTALLTSVPSGVVPQVLFRTVNTDTKRVVSNNVGVYSNDTTGIVDLNQWQYSRQLYFNTTIAGAATSGDVTNFPVLVRLTSKNFEFSKATNGGKDVRFSKSNNVPLVYEIVQWDSAGATAEIWVKIDTIYGNDSSHYMIMYWGNQNTISVSSPEMVFDTSDGFLGVWHLGNTNKDGFSDATYNHYVGTEGATAPASIEGMVGRACSFDGLGNGLVMRGTEKSPLNVPLEGSFTFSAWVKVDTVYSEDGFIAGKGHDQYSLRVKGSTSIPQNKLALHEYDNRAAGTDMRYIPVETGQWKYMSAIRKDTLRYLYIDGVCIDSKGMVFNEKKIVVDTVSFSIGRCAAPFNNDNYLPFKGGVDEVRISGVARSADWIKLCYMNQKIQDKLIQYKNNR
jgi:hypothetical protein